MNKTYWDCQFPIENDIAFVYIELHIPDLDMTLSILST